MDRRNFVKQNAILAGSLFTPGSLSTALWKKRKFRMCLNAGAIGANLGQNDMLDAAIKYGYEAIIPLPEDLQKMSSGERNDLIAKMKEHNISWGSAGLPLNFRNDAVTFKEGLSKLPLAAAAVEAVGGTRMNTWIMPTHADFTYKHNFHLHTDRLREVATILGHHGIRLGLEYVGPKTLLTLRKYSFIRTMTEAKELMASIDRSNVGFVLDSFHWYCAGESKKDILTLTADDVVTVDLNDARTGFEVDDQIDSKRELPLATGVIPIQDFLEGLVQIGYEGPVRAEPFNQPLREMSADMAVKTTYEAMRKAFDLVDG